MTRFFQIPSLPLVSWSSLAIAWLSFWGTSSAQAQVPLTRADVESIYNQVEFIPEGQSARPARLNDWLSVGDALRTALGARAELRFNDGSLARVGERATFWFVPNTRDFRLSNGTALFLIPPDRGPSNIRTPSAVTGIQGTALVVRHIPRQDCDASVPFADENACPGRTVVMVLTDSPKGPVEVTASDGDAVLLSAGDLAVVENGNIQVMEFNLQLFYDTSPLVEGLELDNPDFEGTGMPTDPVRQETWSGIQSQVEFNGNFLLNPNVIGLDAQLGAEMSWLLPADDASSLTLANDAIATPFRALRQIDNSRPAQNVGSQPLMSTWLTNTVPGLDVPQASVPGLVVPPEPPAGRPDIPGSGVIRPTTSSVVVPAKIVPVEPLGQRPPEQVPGRPPTEIPVEAPSAELPGGGPPSDLPGWPDEFPGGPDELPGDDGPVLEGPVLEGPFDPAS